MSRKLQKIVSLFLVVYGSSVVANHDFETNKFTPVQKFYYKMGVEKSKKTYYEMGYQKAVQDFAVLLKEYEQTIKMREAGKYLIESGKITYPEAYRTRLNNGDGYQIHLETPIVEREFTKEDLFILPLLEHSLNGKNITVNNEPKIQYPNSRTQEDGITDSFSIPSMNEDIDIPSRPSDLTQKVYVDINIKSSNIKEFLDAYNSKYSTTEKGYKIEFASEAEKRDFCINLTGTADCQGLN